MDFEVIGILATLFIVLAFSMNGELKIRVFDLVGALLFIVYGALIKSFSTILLNSILVLIQVHKIYQLKKGNKNEN